MSRADRSRATSDPSERQNRWVQGPVAAGQRSSGVVRIVTDRRDPERLATSAGDWGSRVEEVWSSSLRVPCDGPYMGSGAAWVLGARTAVPLLASPCRAILANMALIVRRIAERRSRFLAASGLASLVLILAVSSAAAAVGSLSAAQVPTTAVVGTAVTIRVTYTDTGHVAPTSVRVCLDGVVNNCTATPMA